MTWTSTLETPLLPFVAGDRRRARFAVHSEPPPELPPVAGLLAGAAEVDVTPPPGMPKAGYSGVGRDGVGFRSRLRARVLHLRSDTASLALVQCDLLGGSAVVHHLVGHAIAPRTDVPLAGLFLGATHTHGGPGQFLGSDFYNRFASNRAGFDAAYTQFLVERITGAIEQAVATRSPARLAWGHTQVWGMTRNRSLAPYVNNDDVDDKRTEPQRKFLAINPWLHLLRVDRAAPAGGFEPLTALVVFSVHGTGISRHAGEYNADLWAYLVGELAHRIERSHGRRPVVGAVEGTHADVAPALRPGAAGYLEARRVGAAIGADAATLYAELDGALTDRVPLATGLRELDLAHSRGIDGITLPRRPAAGAVLLSGAHENTTPILHRLPFFRAGSPKRRGHDPKRVIGTRWLQPAYVPLAQFPRVLPVQIVQVGPVALVGLPFETTVEAGCRVEARVARVLAGSGVERVVVSSVANEYAGYVVTPEEYALQHYEGGHTLFGPQTQPFLAAHAARLASDTLRSGLVADVLAERRFDLRLRRFLPRPVPDSFTREPLSGARFSDPTRNDDACWELQWRDTAPANLTWHEPLVRVDTSDHGDDWSLATHAGRSIDDSGFDLGVVHLGAHADGHHYAVRWYEPELRAGRRHRFVLLANAGRREVASEPFD